MKPRAQLFAEIAQKHLCIPTLETRRSDRLDFHEVAVWAVAAALNATFDAGAQSTGNRLKPASTTVDDAAHVPATLTTSLLIPSDPPTREEGAP